MRLYFGQFVGYDKVITWLKQSQQQTQKLLDQLTEKYSLYKDKISPTQVICIQIGIKEYTAKLEVIVEGLAQMEQLEQRERE